MADGTTLGAYLRNRRTRLDPASFGISGTRRRTSGLRREEVAQAADISATWYTWLEQGRGGAPSADVLDRLAGALRLTEVEREHLYLIGLGRPPEVRSHAADPITPRLQRMIDALNHSPAIVRTATWDVVAWNGAAAAVFTDYAALPPEKRNILKMLFADRDVRDRQSDWEGVARFVVGAFRIDAARAGAETAPLVEELCRTSPDFARMWNESEVRSHGEGVKHLRHPRLGTIALEFSSFAVDGRPDLGLIVYTPQTEADRVRVETLVREEVREAAE